MNHSWFSPSQLAELPTMPNSKRLVNILVSNDGDWVSRPRSGRGGGKEYQIPERYQTPELIAALPSQTSTNVDKAEEVVAIVEPLIADAPIVAALIDEDSKVDHIPDAENMDNHFVGGNKNAEGLDPDLALNARYEILKLWSLSTEACVADGGSKLGCDTIFVEKIKSGEIEIPEWVRKGISAKDGKIKLSRALLFQWKKLSESGAAALRPNLKGKTGQSFFDLRPDYCVVAEALCREFGASVKIIHHAFTCGIVKDDFGLEDIPTEAQIGLWLKKRGESNTQRARAFRTGDMTILKSAFGSYSRGLKPNDKWEIDSTKADAVTDKDSRKKENVILLQSRFSEKPVRCALVVCMDVATRMIKILVRPTSNGEAICLVMAECIKDWGLPKLIKTDNGKDYIGKQVIGFSNAMGIEQEKCVVKKPMQKPHIERSMRRLQHSPDWKMLPWSTGHNVSEQQALRKRREGELVLPWTLDRFQAWCDRWTESYHNTVHGSLGCTPLEKLASFRSQDWVALMPKNLEKNLEFAMMLEDLATVNKQGIRYQGRFYIAPELIGSIGEKVAIRFSEKDPNQIYVYSSTDLKVAKFICIATWDLALSPEEQAKIASAKPLVDEANKKFGKAVKDVQRKITTETTKYPERTVRIEGSATALRAVEAVQVATQELVDDLAAAAGKRPEPKADPEMDERWAKVIAKREEDAKPSPILIRTPEDWLLWWDKPELATTEDLKWMIRTADLAGYGKAWLVMRRLDLDDCIAILESRIGEKAA